MLYSHIHVHAASQRHHNYDAVKKTAGSKTQEDFFNKYILPLTLLQGFQRVAYEKELETEYKL